ncbi:hypothetical protein AJ79_07947 [Helicocarpus griseus UAMH5409]|uniref:Uncharacterized protein n=1 Tax=Helicocarpus griseus UAMH5409 TaxID=1447875 RepID=A0A2B7WXJ6_9EURO|nr:hypothetical protein AJ79_07947 [Helicocarpus griseus UAMH5409]
MLPHILPYLALTAIHLFSGVNAAAIGTIPSFDNPNNLGSTTHVARKNVVPPPGQNVRPAVMPKKKTKPGSNNYDYDIDNDGDVDQDDLKRLPPEQVKEFFKLVSQIPDSVFDKGTDAVEDWLRKYRSKTPIKTKPLPKKTKPKQNPKKYNKYKVLKNPHQKQQPHKNPQHQPHHNPKRDELQSVNPAHQLDPRFFDKIKEGWNKFEDKVDKTKDKVEDKLGDAAGVMKCVAAVSGFIVENLPIAAPLKLLKLKKIKNAIDKMGGYKKAFNTLFNSKDKPKKPSKNKPKPKPKKKKQPKKKTPNNKKNPNNKKKNPNNKKKNPPKNNKNKKKPKPKKKKQSTKDILIDLLLEVLGVGDVLDNCGPIFK